MSSARGNNRDAFINPYELQKMAQCARNQKKFDELRLAQCARAIQQPIQPRKRIKKTQGTREAAANNHNLRPRPERTSSEIAIANEEIADCETIGDFLSDNEDMHSSTKKKRKGGRRLSRMDDILLKEPGSMPKIKIELNDKGQPIGENYRKLSSVIGVQTRKMLPVGYSDWRLVDAEMKMALWTDIKALTARGKCNRAKLKFLHTSGSVSYASAAHKLGQQLGRPPRRDEVYIKTHTRKNGVPLGPAASTINELKEVVEARPELMDKTIQQGDAFAAVCGVKEPRGRVRCLGLGPTPQDIGTPGLKAYTSIRLQIQVLARQKAESDNLVLQQRILEMQQREEQRMAREFQNVETISHHGSNSRQQMSPRSEELGEANQHVQGEEDDYVEDDNCDEEPDDEANQQAAAPTASPAMNITASPRNDALAGSEVILFAMSSDEKVAKATVVSVNPNNKLAGEALGTKFCEVIVNVVLRRETLVPRPYDEIKTLGDAVKMPVAWPFNRLKVCSQQPRSSQGVASSSQRYSQGAAGSSQRR